MITATDTAGISGIDYSPERRLELDEVQRAAFGLRGTQVTYRAVDANGNVEAARQLTR